VGDGVAAVRFHVLAFLFGSAEVPYPTSVGHVRVVLCLIQLHPCLVQHLSFSALLSSILSWWHYPSMDPSVGGQGDVLLPLVGSSWYILAVDLSKSQQPSSPLLPRCSLVFANHTMSLSRKHISSYLTYPWQHEATLLSIPNLPLANILWQHEATLVRYP